MRGSISIPFSHLFLDTVREHGIMWTACYYSKRGMKEWEFRFWLRSVGAGRMIVR
jgi:hypothetical protein